MLREVEERLDERGLTLELTEAAKDALVKEGYDRVYGARPLRRVIQNEIEDMLSDRVLDGTFSEGDTVRLDYEDGKVVATKVVHAPAPPPEPVLT